MIVVKINVFKETKKPAAISVHKKRKLSILKGIFLV